MKTTKYIAVAASICGVLLSGCGSETSAPKSQTIPQAAPAKQVETNDKQVISKGKIIGTTTALKNGKQVTVQVEEREVRKMGVTGKMITKKEYYDAESGNPISYDPNEKDVTIKNKGQQVDTFKSH